MTVVLILSLVALVLTLVLVGRNRAILREVRENQVRAAEIREAVREIAADGERVSRMLAEKRAQFEETRNVRTL